MEQLADFYSDLRAIYGTSTIKLRLIYKKVQNSEPKPDVAEALPLKKSKPTANARPELNNRKPLEKK